MTPKFGRSAARAQRQQNLRKGFPQAPISGLAKKPTPQLLTLTDSPSGYPLKVRTHALTQERVLELPIACHARCRHHLRQCLARIKLAGRIHETLEPNSRNKALPGRSNAGETHAKFSEEDALSNATERLRSMEPGFAHYDIEDQTVSIRFIVHCLYPSLYWVYHIEVLASMQGKPNANVEQKTSHKMRGFELRTLPILRCDLMRVKRAPQQETLWICSLT
jgi:hypothetical protein